MKKLFLFTNLLVLSFAHASQVSHSSVEATAKKLCESLFGAGDFSYEELFGEAFRKAVPEEYFLKFANDGKEITGPCKRYEALIQQKQAAIYRFYGNTGRYIEAMYTLHEGQIGGFSILNVRLPDVKIDSTEKLSKYVSTLGGTFSVSIQAFDKKSWGHKNTELQPMASGFKLYVLGLLADDVEKGDIKWNDTRAVRKEWKSGPDGEIYFKSEGTPVEIYEYAKQMIRISDNSATDHLMHILGRDRHASQLKKMGNTFVKENAPFLTTLEAFKIKWGLEQNLLKRYLDGSLNERRAILSHHVTPMPFSKIGTNGVPLDQPSFVRQVEWFGSTDELCDAMKYLDAKKSEQVESILSYNTPMFDIKNSDYWSYAGFKGGSEPGVLTMTYLLKNKSGEAGCVSMAWHNTEEALNNYYLYDLVPKVVELAKDYL